MAHSSTLHSPDNKHGLLVNDENQSWYRPTFRCLFSDCMHLMQPLLWKHEITAARLCLLVWAQHTQTY